MITPPIPYSVTTLGSHPELPVELWILIVQHLSTDDLLQLVRVNRLFYSIAIPILYASPCWPANKHEAISSDSGIGSSQVFSDIDSDRDVSSLWQCILDAFKTPIFTSTQKQRRHTYTNNGSLGGCRIFSVRTRHLSIIDRWTALVSTVPKLGHHIKSLDLARMAGSENGAIARSQLLIDILDDLAFVGDFCPNIHRVNLDGFRELTDTVLCSFLPCNNLTSLNLSECSLITDASLFHIAENCAISKLRSLTLKGCKQISDKGLEAVLSRAPLLLKFRISGCLRVGNSTLETLARNCSRLQWLDISHCPLVGDFGIQMVARKCHDLQWLDIGRSPNANDSSPASEVLILSTIMQIDSTSSVKSEARSNMEVTDASINAIVSNCPKLELLDVSYCSHLTDTALESIASHSFRLKSLCLKGLPRITKTGMFRLGELRKTHKRLIWLQIFQCRNITARVIDQMILRLNDGWRKGPYDDSVHRDVMDGRSWEDVGL